MTLLTCDGSMARDTGKCTRVVSNTRPMQKGLEFLERGGGRQTSSIPVRGVMNSRRHRFINKTAALITHLSCMATIAPLCGVDHPLLVVVVSVASPQMHASAILVPLRRVQAKTMLLDQPSGSIVIPLLICTLRAAILHLD